MYIIFISNMQYFKILISAYYPWVISVGAHLVLFGTFMSTNTSAPLATGLGQNFMAPIDSQTYPANIQSTPCFEPLTNFDNPINQLNTQMPLTEILCEDIKPAPQNKPQPESPVNELHNYYRIRTAWHQRLQSVRAEVQVQPGNLLPEYPLSARQLGQEGLVILKALINRDGSVCTLVVAQSSGYQALDQEALKRVKTWHFQPATYMGIPLETWVIIPIRFRLEG